MKNSKYLSTGTTIGLHYEIIDILGDDDFEILYLVRDTNRKGSFFVLKELFLETFSSRNERFVFTIPEAEDVFNKRKKEIIAEVNYKKNNQRDEIKTYGYIEDNNTIYTIMEFTNNFSLDNYLNFHLRDEILLPPLSDIIKKTTKKSYFFVKLLIISSLVFIGLTFYAKKMIKDDREKSKEVVNVTVNQTPIHHPPLKGRVNPLEVSTTPKVNEVEESSTNIDFNNKNSSDSPFNSIKNNSVYVDSEIEELPQEESIVKKKILNVNTPETKGKVVDEPRIVTPPEIKTIPIEEHKNISLGTKIETSSENSSILGTKIQKESKDIFDRVSIKHFLDNFIESSATGSIEDIASQYDYHIDRYFSLRNITQSAIKRDKRRYNKKWTDRYFKIESFKILKKYKRDGNDYCNIQTVTKWRVATNHGKRASGKSRGLMIIKKTDNGFKVKSIYTLR